jgi:hypothetical protein
VIPLSTGRGFDCVKGARGNVRSKRHGTMKFNCDCWCAGNSIWIGQLGLATKFRARRHRSCSEMVAANLSLCFGGIGGVQLTRASLWTCTSCRGALLQQDHHRDIRVYRLLLSCTRVRLDEKIGIHGQHGGEAIARDATRSGTICPASRRPVPPKQRIVPDPAETAAVFSENMTCLKYESYRQTKGGDDVIPFASRDVMTCYIVNAAVCPAP